MAIALSLYYLGTPHNYSIYLEMFCLFKAPMAQKQCFYMNIVYRIHCYRPIASLRCFMSFSCPKLAPGYSTPHNLRCAYFDNTFVIWINHSNFQNCHIYTLFELPSPHPPNLPQTQGTSCSGLQLVACSECPARSAPVDSSTASSGA